MLYVQKTVIYFCQLLLILFAITMVPGILEDFAAIYSTNLLGTFPTLSLYYFVCVVGGFILLLFLISRLYQKNITNRTFLLWTSAVYLIVQVLSIIFLKIDWSIYHIDYRVAYNLWFDIFTKEPQNIFPLFFSNTSSYSKFQLLYLERGSMYLLPIFSLFGTGYIHIQLVNTALVLVIMFCIFDIARLLFNDRVAKCAVLCFMLIPTRMFYQLIPNYDVSGLFYLTLFQWLLIRILLSLPRISIKRFVVLVVYLSFLLFVTCLARTIRLHLTITLILTIGYMTIIQNKPKWTFRIVLGLLLFFIPVIFAKFGLYYFSPLQRFRTNASEIAFSLMSYFSPSFNNSGSHNLYFTQYHSSDLLFFTDYAKSLITSDLYFNPNDFFSMIIRKCNFIWSLSGEFYTKERFYLPQLSYLNLSFICLAFRAIFTLLVLVGVLRIKQVLPNKKTTILVVAFPAAFFMIHILAEVAHRYVFLLYFNFSIIAGVALDGIAQRKNILKKAKLSQWLIIVLLFFVVYYAAPPIFNYYAEHSNRLMTPLKNTSQIDSLIANGETAQFDDSKKVYSEFTVPLANAGTPLTLTWDGDKTLSPGNYDLTCLVNIEDMDRHMFNYDLQFAGATIQSAKGCYPNSKRVITGVTFKLNKVTTPTFSLTITHPQFADVSTPTTMKGRLECVWIRPAKTVAKN